VLDGDETASAIWTGYGSTTYYLSVYLAIVFFSTFSKGQGKIKALKVALLVQLIGGASNYFIFIPGVPVLMLVNSFLMGFGAQGTWLLVGSMIADIGDEDELNTGNRREGSFSSIFSNVVKLSFTLGFGVSGVLLELTGFDVEASTNQVEVFMKMKLYMAIIPVVALIFGLWVVGKYSITEDKAARIRGELEARRGKI
jgi:GPH family glycoside/pentoside/hexuronide:cation symporter